MLPIFFYFRIRVCFSLVLHKISVQLSKIRDNSCWKMKKNRELWAKKTLYVVVCRCLERILFTDEKIFTVQPIFNPQNDCQLLKRDLKNTFASKWMIKQHFLKSLMVSWAGFCAIRIIPHIFLDQNNKTNTQVYQQNILKVVDSRQIFLSTRLDVGQKCDLNDSSLQQASSWLLVRGCFPM